MENVEGMMQKLKLSAAEKKGIKIGPAAAKESAGSLVQAIGKLLSEKPAPPEAFVQTLGRIWCPIRGIDCKDWGDNHYLFTFHQASGKRKALEGGPWTLSKELLVVSDFDGSKSLEEIEFFFIPIWVRITKLPLGMMNKATGEVIGEEMGDFMEVDLDDNGPTTGRYLRVKVRLDIRNPLRRGGTVFVGPNDEERWCPLSYEFLRKGEIPQYGKELQKALFLKSGMELAKDGDGDEKQKEKGVHTDANAKQPVISGALELSNQVSSPMNNMHVDQKDDEREKVADVKEKEMTGDKTKRKVKRMARMADKVTVGSTSTTATDKKRRLENVDVMEVEESKKARSEAEEEHETNQTIMDAGLAFQPCEH
ncbi:hypothetical protein BAE44_0011034 [Dichanthelium oligosanthes]|uniref:Uncharacterized protein n=1 Tax=Dichanthelium oligosanthes TaxID=888268 RepID=A0A1E5VS56_9POAL|nr:hypothetical protein BAE44_0011034 [Dichanthelium oligosanthes]